MVKSDGTIQDRYNRYLAFGGDDGSSTTLNNAYKYTGKPFDDEHGFDLFYYGARYYDADIGRFYGIDPRQDLYPGQNPYHYTLNNPIKYIDPNGEFVGLLAGALAVAYIVLATPDVANAPTELGDLHDYTFGEKTVQWGFAIAGAAGIIAKGQSIASSNTWQGPVDYTKIPKPKNVGAGKKFTQTQKKNMLEANTKANKGKLRSDKDGSLLNKPHQMKKGQKANMSQAEVDHVVPKSKGGSNSNSNAQILSKKQNLLKKDNVE